MIDLHTHSTASDGSLTPTQLIAKALEQNLRYLGLTDHDTTAGLAEAQLAAKNTELEVVNGIELSAKFESRTVHIIGLGIDPENLALQQLIADAQQSRAQRAIEIGRKLEQSGITDAYAATVEMAGTDILGRGHFAQMLVNRGLAKNFKKVFKRYMVRGKPGYVSANWCTMDQAISTIHQAGGAAVLAHPLRYGLSNRQIELLVAAFADCAGDGLEMISGNTSQKEISCVKKLADKHQLSASIGSDFHGPDKPWATLGQLAELPEDCKTVWHQHHLWS
ncbi:MAG: PHP domain-containing protein [Acidiferrobacterales bacterium]|nr:PHP domain-containing protein [Acidiferrobacterales bacterium]